MAVLVQFSAKRGLAGLGDWPGGQRCAKGPRETGAVSGGCVACFLERHGINRKGILLGTAVMFAR